MGEYRIKVAEFTFADMINNREVFNRIREACMLLVGERVCLKSADDMWVVCKDWYEIEDKMTFTKSLYLVYEAEEPIDKERGVDIYLYPKVSPQLINITLEYPVEEILESGAKSVRNSLTGEISIEDREKKTIEYNRSIEDKKSI